MNIKEAVKKLAATGAEIYCKICTVDAVDENARTVDVTPLDDTAPILGVNLQANQESAEGVVAFPKKGSHVVVAFLNNAAAVVVLHNEIECVKIKIADSEMTIDKDGYKIERQGENLNKALADFITEVTKIIVVQGTSPNIPALEQIKQRIAKILV